MDFGWTWTRTSIQDGRSMKLKTVRTLPMRLCDWELMPRDGPVDGSIEGRVKLAGIWK